MTVHGLEKTLVGVAGEYLVAGELSLRGFIASITLRNSRGIDIIASSSDASRKVSIQVKSSNTDKPSWRMNKKSETYHSPGHFYVLVVLKPAGVRADFYVVPSGVIAAVITTDHQDWLMGKKKDGSDRKDSGMRVFKDSEGKFAEAWHLLGLAD